MSSVLFLNVIEKVSGFVYVLHPYLEIPLLFFFNTKRGEYSSISIFIILAQRSKAIMTPLAPRQSHGTLWTAIALIWFVFVTFPAGFKHPNNEKLNLVCSY